MSARIMLFFSGALGVIGILLLATGSYLNAAIAGFASFALWVEAKP